MVEEAQELREQELQVQIQYFLQSHLLVVVMEQLLFHHLAKTVVMVVQVEVVLKHPLLVRDQVELETHLL